MNIAKFSINNPVFVNLVMAGILLFGLYTAIKLPLELFPSVELEIVTIETFNIGASAEDMEQTITIPIEDEISKVSSVDLVRSVSSQGRSYVVAEIRPGEDISKVAEEIRSEIANIKNELPENAIDPVVKEVDPRFPILSVSIAGDVPRAVLRNQAIRISDDLKLVPGVESVINAGLGDPVFWIKLNPEKMIQYNVGIEQMAIAIRNKNLDLPSGAKEQGDGVILVRIEGRVRSADDLGGIPVRRSADGRHVLLSDIASIELGEEKTLTTSRINGQPAINLWINKQKNTDSPKTVKIIKDKLNQIRKTLPEGITVYDTNDTSYWVEKRFQTMLKSGIIGLILVLITLALFLDIRAAAMTALGIPVAFFGAFILMGFSNITLSVLSMFGLITVLGIIVDDAIIVAENIQRHLQSGLSPKDAAVKGTMEVARPVIATILTNIASFLPLLLATGLIGKFISFIPKVAIYVLLVSMIEALLILPSHCAEVLKPYPPGVVMRGWVRKFRYFYLKGLFFVVRHRYVVTGSFIVVFIMTSFIMYKLPRVLFYASDIIQFMVRVENAPWSNLDETTKQVSKIEDIIKETSPEGALNNTISLMGMDLSNRAPVFGDHLSTIFVELQGFETRKENGVEIMRDIQKKTALTVVGPVVVDFILTGGPPAGKPVDVRIHGRDFDRLKEIAGGLEKRLENIPGVYGVSNDFLWGKPELKVEVDEMRAALYGLDTLTVARAVRAAIDGLKVSTTRIDKEEVDIILIYDFPDGNILNLLETYQIAAPGGGWVPLAAVADLTVAPSLLSISRYNLERAVRVIGEIDQTVTTASEVNSGINEYLTGIKNKFSDFTFSFGGEQKETQESLDSILRAALISIILIYTILATILRSYLQPLIIMSILPFALIGAVVGILIKGDPVSFPALIGVVALLGIVVNDSLVLMDFINQRKKTMHRVMAVVMASKHRFRPIILTTVTTFAGLFSLMLQTRGEAAFLAPMALVLGFGLVFATVITLYFIPSLYLILDDASIYLSKKLKR